MRIMPMSILPRTITFGAGAAKEEPAPVPQPESRPQPKKPGGPGQKDPGGKTDTPPVVKIPVCDRKRPNRDDEQPAKDRMPACFA